MDDEVTFYYESGPPPCPPNSVSPPPSPSILVESDTVPIMGCGQVRNDAQNEESENDKVENCKEDTVPMGFCHPQAPCNRGLALLFMCFMGFGSYFCYDNPGALQSEIKSVMKISTYQFENLYSWYSWPNVLLPIIGGYFVDNIFGMRLAAFIFAVFILLGQILTSLGAFYENFPLMTFSRFVFGMGGESLSVAQNTYASAWFKGDILNLVFGLQTSIARLGSTVNFQVVEPLYHALAKSFKNADALGWTMAISGATCAVSVICSVFLAFMDKRRERYTRERLEATPKIRFRDVLVFPMSFWLICIICVGYYVAIFPFVTLGKVYFQQKYEFSNENASFITGLLYLMSAFLSPVMGFVIDLTGRNITYVLASIIITLFSHTALAFTSVNPYFCMVPMGIGYSMLCSSLWPMIALILPLHRQGTAFGMMQAIQNLGLAVISLLSGLIVDNYGYLWLEVFFIFWLFAAAVAALMLLFVDKFTHDSFLNMSRAQRQIYEQERQSRLAEETARLVESSVVDEDQPVY